MSRTHRGEEKTHLDLKSARLLGIWQYLSCLVKIYNEITSWYRTWLLSGTTAHNSTNWHFLCSVDLE